VKGARLGWLDLSQRLDEAVARQLHEHRHPQRRPVREREQVAGLDRTRDVSDAEFSVAALKSKTATEQPVSE